MLLLGEPAQSGSDRAGGGVDGILDRWLANDGAEMRLWLIGYVPEVLDNFIANAPFWAIALATLLTGIGMLGGLIWAGMNAAEKGGKVWRMLKALPADPKKAIRDVVSPDPAAKRKDIEGLDTKVVAHGDLLAQMKAQLDRMEAKGVAEGAVPLGPEERTRRNTAAAEIVAETTPTARAAARELAAGDLAGAISTLKREARADMVAAAEKWRRLGALVRGANTTEARAAYEEALRLEPDNFWTCIELSRLRQEAGDLNSARVAALAAERAARADRDHLVAAGALGDVLREGGDLAGARSRHEAGLAVRERLARENPGSAEAQRHAPKVCACILAKIKIQFRDCGLQQAPHCLAEI